MSTISTTNVAKHATAVPAFAAALALTVPILACASWGDDSEGNPLRRFFVTLAVAAIGAVVVAGWAVPRGLRNPDGLTAIVLAGAAVVSLGIFWLGLTAVIATGAILVGVAGWNGPRHPSLQRVAVTVAALACLGFAALALVPVLG